MRQTFHVLALAVGLLIPAAPSRAAADSDIPPVPKEYYHDEAHLVDAATAQDFNHRLADFERQTSNQIVVAIYPKMNTDDELSEYCDRIFHAWGVGQKKLNNGAILFVFVQDHKMRIQTGYGLEGALTDITCQQILHSVMK